MAGNNQASTEAAPEWQPGCEPALTAFYVAGTRDQKDTAFLADRSVVCRTTADTCAAAETGALAATRLANRRQGG